MEELFSRIFNYLYVNLLSVIALGISIFNLLYYLISNRKKIDIIINCYTTGKVDDKTFYMYDVDFINQSSLSISINGMKMNDCNNEYYIINSPRKLYEKQSKKNNMIIDSKEINSVCFPINLQGFMASHNFLIMYGPNQFKGKKQKIIISTSRGRITKKINISEKYITTTEFMDNEKHYSM